MLQQFTPQELRMLAALRERYEEEDGAEPAAAKDEAQFLGSVQRWAMAVLVAAVMFVGAALVWLLFLLAQLQQ